VPKIENYNLQSKKPLQNVKNQQRFLTSPRHIHTGQKSFQKSGATIPFNIEYKEALHFILLP
jgi:hypothetical protein